MKTRFVCASAILLALAFAACQYGYNSYYYGGAKWMTINAKENDQDTCKPIGACLVKPGRVGNSPDDCVSSTLGFWRGPARIGADGKLIGWVTGKDRGTCGVNFYCWNGPTAPLGTAMNARGPIPAPSNPVCNLEEE